jgi:hypothetical protein
VRLAGKRGGISLDERGLSFQDFVSRRCIASIYEVLPKQFLETDIEDVLSQKDAGNKAARQCIKLLNEGRFRK